MKYLFLIGGSGTGKTTLAKALERIDPQKYYRVVECTTRDKRPEEIDDFDYNFISVEEFERLKKECKFFEILEYQFNNFYGATFDSLDPKRWNILVVSMEGLLSSLNNVDLTKDQVLILHILIDDQLDILRDNRDALQEQRFNLGVFRNLDIADTKYVELPLSELKVMRNDSARLLEYFESRLPEETPYAMLVNSETKEELVKAFRKNSKYFERSTILLDVLECCAEKLGTTVEEVCNLAKEELTEENGINE